jgi:hypothetical protein
MVAMVVDSTIPLALYEDYRVWGLVREDKVTLRWEDWENVVGVLRAKDGLTREQGALLEQQRRMNEELKRRLNGVEGLWMGRVESEAWKVEECKKDLEGERKAAKKAKRKAFWRGLGIGLGIGLLAAVGALLG